MLEAAARLGLGNLSLRALSQELGVSPRMLLYHFGSRDGLLDAIADYSSILLAQEPARIERAFRAFLATLSPQEVTL